MDDCKVKLLLELVPFDRLLYLTLDDALFVAQHDFKANDNSHLPFKKGDKLKVLQE